MNDELQANLVKALNDFGLTGYEAKTYLALLSKHPAHGNDISRRSGVPGPKIYETLDRLKQKGLVAALETAPVTYEPLPYKELLRQQRNLFSQTEKYLSENLPLVASPTQSIVLWKQDGYDTLISKACQLICSAQSSILISFWQRESGDIEAALHAAESRGVKVVTVQYGPEYLPIGKVFRHIMSDLILERHQGTLTLVADDQAGLFMGQIPGRDWSGFWTTHPGISRLIANYIRHDIFACKLLQRLGKVLGDEALANELPHILNLLED